MQLRDIEQHVLRGNKSKAMPQRMLFFDTEADEEVRGHDRLQTMGYAWSCYVYQDAKKKHNVEKWRFHTDRRRFWLYVISLALDRQPLYVFAHNAYYDLQASGFFHYFKLWRWQRTFYYDQGVTYLIGIRKAQKSIKVISTTNYFQCRLEELGRMVGYLKHPVNPLDVDRETGMIYCFRDVEIIVETIMRYREFIGAHDLGSFRLTRASQAFAAYRHRFMPEKILVHGDEEVTALERSCFFGGRAECFRLGRVVDGPFLSLDINSMYPYLMKNLEVPVRLVDVLEKPSRAKVEAVLRERLVVAEAVVETEEPCYALRKDKKLLFPVGRFRTGLCTAGMMHAIEHNHLIEVKKMATYEGGFIFNDFVDYFYGLRKRYKEKGDRIYEQFCKYLLNSLYGKFGQMQPIVEIEEDYDGPEYFRHLIFDNVTGELETVTQMLNIATMETGEVVSPTSLVAIPAHITEYGRFLLLQIMREVGPARVLYCDTDSIKIRKRDFRRITYPRGDSRLGALKVEKEIQELWLFGVKDYVEDDVVKLAGIPKSAEKLDRDTYRYWTWNGQDTHLRWQESRVFILSEATRTLTRQYTKGRLQRSGRVLPLRVSIA